MLVVSIMSSQYVNERCKMIIYPGPLRVSLKSHFEKPLKMSSSLKTMEQTPRFSLLQTFALKALSVENIGVEPMTSCVQGRRSSQLS